MGRHIATQPAIVSPCWMKFAACRLMGREKLGSQKTEPEKGKATIRLVRPCLIRRRNSICSASPGTQNSGEWLLPRDAWFDALRAVFSGRQ